MRRYIKEFNRYLDITLKIIPALITFVFIESIIFNLSYFNALNSEWTMLLSLPDYYEGSIFAIHYIFILGMISLVIYMLPKFLKTIYRFCIYFLRCIRIFCICIFLSCQMLYIQTKLKTKTFSLNFKKKYVALKKELHNIWWELMQILSSIFKILIPLIILELFLFFSALHLTYTTYLYNWKLLLIALLVFYLFIVWQKKPKSKLLVSICCGILLFSMLMWNLGAHIATQSRGYDFLSISKYLPTQKYSLASINGQKYRLIRALNKGILVKKDEKLLFFKWEDVASLEQDYK